LYYTVIPTGYNGLQQDSACHGIQKLLFFKKSDSWYRDNRKRFISADLTVSVFKYPHQEARVFIHTGFAHVSAGFQSIFLSDDMIQNYPYFLFTGYFPAFFALCYNQGKEVSL